MNVEKPSLKSVYDALTADSSADADPDWCAAVLEEAAPGDIARVRAVLGSGITENEAAYLLDIWPR